ncbi:N-6 DNA methylase [Thermoactinomyces mirandus]|uniref:N-6 DNA methylase n=1 Tax=Thermoactinomyces mirandus TaxID=2756294 RepID=UPI0015EECF57|nr:N-6 DNA methylase [Thermoactinomyces mirandus]
MLKIVSVRITYDGAVGSGSFLIEAAKYAYPNKVELYGQDSNPDPWAICKQNMILHGLYDTHIEIGDTMKDPKWVEDYQLKKFDYILMNPPFGYRVEIPETDPYGRNRYGIPSLTSGELSFVLHALASLKPEGIAAIVVAPGILFRGGPDKKVRQSLLKEDLIEAVIALPPNLFTSTAIPVAILILNRKKTQPGKVQFILANTSYEKERGRNCLRAEDIEKIAKACRQTEEVAGFSRLVSVGEIEDNDYILSVERYIEPEETIEATIGMAIVRRNAYEQSNLPLKALGKLSDPKPFRGINPPRESEEEPNYELINLVDVQDGKILFDQLKPAYVDPCRALRFEVREGNVLVSGRGTALKVAIMGIFGRDCRMKFFSDARLDFSGVDMLIT